MFLPLCEVLAEGTWAAYTSTKSVYDVCSDGNNVWCATTGGIVRRNQAETTLTTYTILDGLKDNNVHSVAVSSTGILWAGYTDGGLSSYDGETWTTHTEFNEVDTWINAIAAGYGNMMWFGSNRGMSCYYVETWTSYDLEGSEVLSVTVAPDSIVWAGTTRGVYRFNGVEWEHFSLDDGLPGNAVNAITVGVKGTVWACTDQGLVSYDSTTWTTHPEVSSSVESIFVSPDSTIWCGAHGRLYRYDGKTWTTIYMDSELGYDDIDALYISSDGTVWAGTSEGLFIYHKDRWTKKTTNGPLSNHASQLAESPDGCIWSSIYRDGNPGGVSKYDGTMWTSYSNHNKLKYTNTRSIAVGMDGKVWCATGDGVFCYNGSTWTHDTEDDGLLDERVTSLSIDSDGKIWVVTYTGLSVFDGDSWSTATTIRPFTEPVVFGGDGTIWLAAAQRLYRYDGDRWIMFDQIGNLPQRIATSLACDSGGIVWVGAYGGVCRVDGGKWTTYEVTDEMLHDELYNIASMAFDSANRLWCIIRGGGLFCFENEQWTHYSTGSNLIDSNLQRLIVGQNNAVWCTSYQLGIYHFTLEGSPAHAHITDNTPSPVFIAGNYPNPFNASTNIEFTLPENGMASLVIYSITGQKIRTLVSDTLSAGTHSVIWDGLTDRGTTVSSGIYLTHLRMNSNTAVHKVLFMK